MPAITITDLNKAKQDVDHIAAVATSTAATATDRLGNVKNTLAGAMTAFEADLDAALAVVDDEVAATAAGQASRAKDEAILARDAALIQAGVYASEELGRAAVADGVAFKVQGYAEVAAYEYRRVNASSSTLIATYPSKSAIDNKLNTGGHTIGSSDAIVFVDPVSQRVAGRVDENGAWHITAKDEDGNPYVSTEEGKLPGELVPYVGDYTPVEQNDTALLFVDPASNRILLRGDEQGRLYGDFYSFNGMRLADEAWLDLVDSVEVSPIYGAERLRQTTQRLRSILNGDAATLAIAAIGDSWTGNSNYWLRGLTTFLQTRFGSIGPGWLPFAASSSGASSSTTNSDAIATPTGAWTIAYTSGNSPDIGQVTSSSAGAKYTVTGPAGLNQARLFGSSGTIRYRWDGAAWNNLALVGDGMQTVGLTGLPSAQWTLEIEVVSGTVKLSGLDLRKDGSGVTSHKLGKNGSHTGQWAGVNATDFQNGLSELGSNLYTILHGTNDQWLTGSTRNTPQQYKTNLMEIVNRIRVATPYADILLITPPTSRTEGLPMADYAAAMREVAIEKKTAHLYLQPFFGDALADYAYGSGRPLLDSTLIHPSTPGGKAVIVDAILSALNCYR